MTNLSNQAVIVSGASGYIGRRLVSRLAYTGVDVFAFDLINNENLPPNVYFFKGPFSLAKNKINDWLSARNLSVSVVFHLAGESNRSECEKNPQNAFESIIQLSNELLVWSRKKNVSKFLFLSSGAVYGESTENKFTENNSIYPQGIYSGFKAAAENMVHSFCSNLMVTANVRLANVYGPDIKENTVIGRLLSQRNNPRIELETLSPVRDFIHVEDVITGLIVIASNFNEQLTVNLSTGIGVSIGELAKVFCKLIGRSESSIYEISSHANIINPSKVILSNDLLVEKTGWMPQLTIKQGLQLVIQSQIDNQ